MVLSKTEMTTKLFPKWKQLGKAGEGMRECKHEFEWYRDDTSRCRGCGIVVPDKIATLIDAEDNYRLPAREWIEMI